MIDVPHVIAEGACKVKEGMAEELKEVIADCFDIPVFLGVLLDKVLPDAGDASERDVLNFFEDDFAEINLEIIVFIEEDGGFGGRFDFGDIDKDIELTDMEGGEDDAEILKCGFKAAPEEGHGDAMLEEELLMELKGDTMIVIAKVVSIEEGEGVEPDFFGSGLEEEGGGEGEGAEGGVDKRRSDVMTDGAGVLEGLIAEIEAGGGDLGILGGVQDLHETGDAGENHLDGDARGVEGVEGGLGLFFSDALGTEDADVLAGGDP